jgi:hypothetical protein
MRESQLASPRRVNPHITALMRAWCYEPYIMPVMGGGVLGGGRWLRGLGFGRGVRRV